MKVTKSRNCTDRFANLEVNIRGLKQCTYVGGSDNRYVKYWGDKNTNL